MSKAGALSVPEAADDPALPRISCAEMPDSSQVSGLQRDRCDIFVVDFACSMPPMLGIARRHFQETSRAE
jgi:hypothetical protein